MAGLPLIVAGPIVRRVEPRLVCVWVALSQPGALRLTVFEGRQQTGAGDGMFTGGEARARGAANSLRVGQKLHVGVVVAEVEEPAQPLTPGQNFSYNVAVGPFVPKGSELASQAAVLAPDEVRPTADLKSLKLLRDGPIDDRPHLPLGYQAGELPGFALPPAELTNLRMLHGSCRRPAFVYPEDPGGTTFDGLAWVDDLILKWRGTGAQPPFDANVRPHQLFLTGDQIYADDVSSPMLPMLNQLGGELLGRIEQLPTRYPPKADEPSKEAYLGVPVPRGFATITEFVRKKKEQGRDPFEALQDDRRVRAVLDTCLKRRFHMVYSGTFAVDPAVQRDPDGLCQWPADLRHFPAALRVPVMECEARFSSVDLGNHLMAFGEYCAMYLTVLSNAAWPLQPNGRPVLATVDEVLTLPNTLPQLWDLHACVPDREKFFTRSDRTGLTGYLDEERRKPGQINHFTTSTATLNAFYDSLPRVRRALANIPTYMIFDDHDVTDDWNLSRPWRDQVHTAPLGRRIVTSALVTYALFQDWGNDPKRYRDGPRRRLLEAATQLFPPGTAPTTPPAVMDGLARILSLNQPDPEQPPPAVRWHFSVDGPRHRVVALDCRTRRHFRSRHLPPGLLTPEALDEQLPDPAARPLPPGIEALVVVSQSPVVLPALASAVIMPLTTALKTTPGPRDPEGAAAKDNEIWPGDAQAYERLLERLAAYKRVVVLSGEVHHGFSGQLTYWSKGPKRLTLPAAARPDLDGAQVSARLAGAFQTAGFPLSAGTRLVRRPDNEEWLVIDPGTRKTFLVRNESDGLNGYEELEPARLAQFTSSGLKNVEPQVATIVDVIGFAFTLLDLLPAERLIWKDSTPAAMLPPQGQRFPPIVRGRVSAEPVLLPTGNWPAGTRMGRRPDFSWRSDLVRDERPDSAPDARPEFARAGAVPELNPSDVDESYREIAKAHAAQLNRLRFSRAVLAQTNLGVVRFERAGEDLVACHDLHGHVPLHDEVTLVNTYRVGLRGFAEQRPMLRFDVPDRR